MVTTTDTAARAADIRTTTYKLADGTRLTADRTAMRADLDWACDQVAALVARVETLEAARRALGKSLAITETAAAYSEFSAGRASALAEACEVIDAALSAGGTTPTPQEAT